jgi:hypothetical protein
MEGTLEVRATKLSTCEPGRVPHLQPAAALSAAACWERFTAPGLCAETASPLMVDSIWVQPAARPRPESALLARSSGPVPVRAWTSLLGDSGVCCRRSRSAVSTPAPQHAPWLASPAWVGSGPPPPQPSAPGPRGRRPGAWRAAAPALPRRPARAALPQLRWRTTRRCPAPPPPAPWRRARAAPACRAAAAAPRSWAARSCCARGAGTGRGSAAPGALRPGPARCVLLFAASLPGPRPLALLYLQKTGVAERDRHANVDETFLGHGTSCQASSQERLTRMEQLTKHHEAL